MSELTIPICQITIPNIYGTVEAWNTNIVQRITDGLDTAEFTCSYDNYNNIDIGHTVDIWIQRDTSAKIFTGRIIRKTVIESGKDPKEILIECHRLPDFTNRYITLTTTKDTQHNIIEDIIQPLIDDGLIISSIDTLGDTVVLQRVTDGEIFATLRDFCNNNTIDFWLDVANNNLYAKYTSDLDTSTLSLDQTNTANPCISNMEYIRDLDRVKNYIKIYSADTKKRYFNDLYTENSIGCWGAQYQKYDGSWSSAASQLISGSLNAGTKSVEVYFDWGDESVNYIRGLMAECTFDSGTTIDMRYGGSLVCYLKFKDYLPKRYDVDWRRGGSSSLDIILYDVSNNTSTINEFIEGSDIKKLSYSIPGNFEYTTFDWSDIRKIRFYFYAARVENGETFGTYWYKVHSIFDDLEFYTYWVSEYTDTASEGSFGTRELIPDRKFYDVTTESDLDNIARKLVDPYTSPEVSPREVEVDGNPEFKKGEKIYIKSDVVDGTFTMNEVEFNIQELDFKNRLILSSSRQYEPVMTREIMEVERKHRLTDISRRIYGLENSLGFRSYSDIPYNQKPGMGVYDPTNTINWGNVWIDWFSTPYVSRPYKLETTAYNYIINPSFEHGTLGWGGDETANTSDTYVKFGSVSARLFANGSRVDTGYSNFIDIRGISTFTISQWVYISSYTDGTFRGEMWVGDKNKNYLEYKTLWSLNSACTYTQYSATINTVDLATGAAFIRVFNNWQEPSPAPYGIAYIDGWAINWGDQIPEFQDYTAYSYRWMPETIITYEVDDYSWSSLTWTDIAAVTFDVDTNMLGLLHIGSGVSSQTGNYYTYGALRCLHNGISICGDIWFGGRIPGCGTVDFRSNVSWTDVLDLEPGSQTIIMQIVASSSGPEVGTASAFERYIRVILGTR